MRNSVIIHNSYFMDLNIKTLCSNGLTQKWRYFIFFFLPDLFFSHSHKPLPFKEPQYIFSHLPEDEYADWDDL